MGGNICLGPLGQENRLHIGDPGTLCLGRSSPPGPLTCEPPQAWLEEVMAASGPVCSAETDRVIQETYRYRVLEVAHRYVGVREGARANRGEEVDAIVEAGGWRPGGAWCAAFAYFCHLTAAAELGGATSCPRPSYPRAAFMWYDATGDYRYTASQILDGVAQPLAGDVMVMARPSSFNNLRRDTRRKLAGHAGIVVRWDAEAEELVTVEGNTDDAGSREGDGVYEKRRAVERNPRGRNKAVFGCVRPVFIPSV